MDIVLDPSWLKTLMLILVFSQLWVRLMEERILVLIYIMQLVDLVWLAGVLLEVVLIETSPVLLMIFLIGEQGMRVFDNGNAGPDRGGQVGFSLRSVCH